MVIIHQFVRHKKDAGGYFAIHVQQKQYFSIFAKLTPETH